MKDGPSGRPGNVVPFVDRATLEVRRQAVRRVREAGIFRLPPEPDGYGEEGPTGEKR